MAIDIETNSGVTQGRRTRELYITTIYGQPYNLTLYRDDFLKTPDGQVFGKPSRDDQPIQMGGNEVAGLTFKKPDGGTFSGAQLLVMISLACDQLDPKNPDGLRYADPNPVPPQTPPTDQVAAPPRAVVHQKRSTKKRSKSK